MRIGYRRSRMISGAVTKPSVGVAMPLSLTILGVFGGFVAFGFLGLFIGPTLLAIGFTLFEAWRAAPPTTPATPVL